MRLVQLSRHSIAFPSPEGALREPNGLLALGGDLSPARLLMAYQRGIFPWFSPGDPILWWSPDPRAVLWPESLHISRSMKRFHKRSPYRVTMNYAFGQVIEGCASDREEGTWITRGVVEAYHRLHELGHAHSIEVWREYAFTPPSSTVINCGRKYPSSNARKRIPFDFAQRFASLCNGRQSPKQRMVSKSYCRWRSRNHPGNSFGVW